MSLKAIANKLRELASLVEAEGSSSGFNAPAPPPATIQGRIRGSNTLHLQRGTTGSYSRADVEVNDAQAASVRKAEQSGVNTNTSFAGSSRRYVVAQQFSDGSLMIDGIAIDNPFADNEQSVTSISRF